jgi:hypothetical protein
MNCMREHIGHSLSELHSLNSETDPLRVTFFRSRIKGYSSELGLKLRQIRGVRSEAGRFGKATCTVSDGNRLQQA